MAIPNKQIGWSQESNLLWEIARKLDSINRSLCTLPCPTTTTTTTTLPITTTTTTTSAPLENRFEFSEGNVPTIEDFETLMGFTLENPSIEGNTIKFTNTGYIILPDTFLGNTGLIDVVSFCIECYDAFISCSNLQTVSFPLCQTLYFTTFGNCFSLVDVYAPNLVSADSSTFFGCSALPTVDFPLLEIVGTSCFSECISLKTIKLPNLVKLGPTVGNNTVFLNITGNTINLTIPAALMTADAGNPDGDIVYLQANNTVTITTV